MKKSFAFNSVDGDRKYNADNIADNTAIFYSNGIVVQNGGVLSTELQVSAVSGMQVKVANGSAIIKGRTVTYYGTADGTETITLDTADATNPRIDRIVLELNLASNVRDIVLKVVTGTPMASPVAPDLVRNDVTYQISLAQVRVNANTSTVGTITDERSNATVCGISNVMVGIKSTDARIITLSSATATLYGVTNADDAIKAAYPLASNQKLSSTTATLYNLTTPNDNVDKALQAANPLAVNQKLSTATAALYNLSGTNANVDNALNYTIDNSSFMAFAGNVNSNMLDAAFGKNVESYMSFLGRQLAMYSYYKGDSSSTYPFTNLKKMHNLTNILATSTAYNEIRANQNLINLFIASPYANAQSINTIPMPGDIVTQQSNGYNYAAWGSRAAGTYTHDTLTVNRAGYYRVKFSYGLYGTGHSIALKKNGTSIASVSTGNGVSSTDVMLASGDVLTLVMTCGGTSYWGMTSPIYLCSAKAITIPASPTAGTRFIYGDIVSTYINSGTSGTAYTYNIVNAGTYRVTTAYTGNAYSVAYTLSINKNGTAQTTASYAAGVYFGTALSYDVVCAAGDVITITYTRSSNSSYPMYIAGASVCATASDNFPA